MPRHFVREIDRLNRQIIEFGNQVENQVKLAIRAVKKSDNELANKVIQQDEKIDELEVELEEECLKLLALHQPMGEDLRLIISILKINNDLERIGDHAVNIAERALQLSELEKLDTPPEIPKLTHQAKLMLRKSLLALVEKDAVIATDVVRADDQVDLLNKKMHHKITDRIKANPEFTEQQILFLSVCRQLERIGDHACNISEDVLYLLTGDIVRHASMPVSETPSTCRKHQP